MLNEQTLTIMNALKLFGMAHSFPERLSSPRHSDLSHEEFVGLLVQDEKTHRENQRLTRILKNAKLRLQAAIEDIDYRHPRGLHKQVLLDLSSTQWIQNHRPVLLSGPTGIGKSFIACALGNLAARSGYSVLYLRAPRLFATLNQARGDGSHLKTLTRLAKIHVLIIDDLLLAPLADLEQQDLMEIVEDRDNQGATVITSQYPLSDWHLRMGDPTLADAICDRLLHNSYKIELKGESIRKTTKTKGEPQP